MMHMIISAIIHGVIYRAIWGLERHDGVHGTVAIAIAVIGAMLIGHMVMRMFFRRRRYSSYSNRSRRNSSNDRNGNPSRRNDRNGNDRNDRNDDGASP